MPGQPARHRAGRGAVVGVQGRRQAQPGSIPAQYASRAGIVGDADPAPQRSASTHRLQPLKPQRRAAQLPPGPRHGGVGRPADHACRVRPGHDLRLADSRPVPGLAAHPLARARSTRMPRSEEASGGLRKRRAETRSRNLVAPPRPARRAGSRCRHRRACPAAARHGRPGRARASWAGWPRTRRPPAPPAALRQATTQRAAATYRRSSQATGRCRARPSLGA